MALDFYVAPELHRKNRRLKQISADCYRKPRLIEVDFNLPAPHIMRTLNRIAAERGYPRKLRLDNGPELVR
jgi:putative transposase